MKKLMNTYVILGLFAVTANAQQWNSAASLSTPNRFVLFSVLNTNKVLCTGGINADITPHAECELFDPSTGLWTLTGSLQVGRILHSVTTLEDGHVAVFGGQTGGAYDGGQPVQTSLVELFDPVTETWSSGGNLVVAREHQTSSLLLDGKVLIVGGLNGTTPLASAEIYDPATKTSTLVASMKQARYEHQATSLADGRVMVTGGRIGGWDGTFFNEVEIYDPTNDTWTVEDAMAQSRMRGLIVQFSDGSILSAAGRNSSTSTAPGSELFDLSTGHWTSTDSMKQPCTWLAAARLPDNRYLATGGFIDATWTNSTDVLSTPKCEWYDKLTKRWFYAPTLNEARAEHGIAYLHQTSNPNLPTDMVLVGGGITGNNTFTSSCEVLDVTPSALEAYKAMPSNHTTSSVELTQTPEFGVRYDAEGEPHLMLTAGNFSNVQMENAAGMVVRNYTLPESLSGTYDLAISHANLSAGIYFLRTTVGGSPRVAKILIP